MKIEKLRSGSYRVRKTQNGITYSVTFDYKPTASEAMAALADKMQDAPVKGTFGEYLDKYIKSRENVASGSTLAGYRSIRNNIPSYFLKADMGQITRSDVQVVTNDYAKTHSPKSVRNFHGLIAAVLKVYRPRLDTRSTLPGKSPATVRVPTDEEVAAVLQMASGTQFEIAFLLAGQNGLRRSEICALDLSDLSDDNILHIHRAKVRNSSGHGYYIKEYAKTEDGNRTVMLAPALADMIRKQGYVYNGGINTILARLHRYQDALEIPHFTLHALRHYFASVRHRMGIPTKATQKEGGWKSDSFMMRVYTEDMTDKDERRRYAEQLSNRIQNALK